MTETITIPLSKLLAWEGNVRQTEPDKNIDELAASIAAHGLLQSLVVKKDKRGKYAVIAGQRRLLALKSLAADGRIENDLSIPCALIDGDADATEISLVENVQREAMHPADEFEAFKALIDKGTPVADIAARFGVTETVVQKRLKLAKVSPVLIAAYRAGEMTLQHVMAFTVTDDHALQERVWNEMPEWQKEDPDEIYDLLTEDEVTAKDRRVKFVGIEAYERAGGTIRRDLFSDDDGVFIEDAVLLESLVAAKLESTAEELRQAGWKWVEIRSTFDHQEWSKYGRLRPQAVPVSPEQQTELDHLQAEHEALWEIEENTEEEEDRIAELAARIHELEDRERVWSPETLAIAGVIVTLGFDGEADIHEGYVKPEDRRTATKADDENGAAKVKTGGLSASLIESLTAHRSAALNAELIRRPDVALAALVSSFVSQVFEHGHKDRSTLQIALFLQPLHRAEGSAAHAVIEDTHGKWDGFPNSSELFAWCLTREQDQLLRLLAYCVAQSVDAVRTKTPHSDQRIAFTATLASALNLDMSKWFKPTAENYFGKVSKAQILEALREAKGSVAPAWADMKKADLAALAERQIAGTGWLPEPLRAAPKTGD
jgi:ParB family transcriptional regulator, chromosome partitioning protein